MSTSEHLLVELKPVVPKVTEDGRKRFMVTYHQEGRAWSIPLGVTQDHDGVWYMVTGRFIDHPNDEPSDVS